MNLRHLRCFVAVGEGIALWPGGAAAACGAVAPVGTIRQLEAGLGVTLLERMPRASA